MTTPQSRWKTLTPMQCDVAVMVVDGLTNRQVAARLFLSRHTVDFHLRHIFPQTRRGFARRTGCLRRENRADTSELRRLPTAVTIVDGSTAI
ncbi:MAG: helix-turn-helix transcriptional regulator [Actinobacteria bacterium]|nr:helix-turn-helix transcriptional regulator [Actinomycetota bacterium]